jgi:molecular chaperone DnaK (HSP70)
MFTSAYTEYCEHRINDEEEFKSIYLPIFTALKKAYLDKNDIDYLLFIGGSSKNPLIQNSLKSYFDETEHLIPQNLQAHVSAGAAIHSLVFNGFGRNIIEPITSEPIIIVISEQEEERLRTIIKAGTTIPCESITINNLRPQKEGQKIIEMPICVGNKNKILHTIKVESANQNGFTLNTKIELKVSISSDKMLIIKATIDGKEIEVEPLNPFSNEEVSIRDRKKFKAEKEFNKSRGSNNGTATKGSLQKLYNEYEELGLELKAAEILIELYEKFDDGSLNNIGVHYSRAGDEEKAMEFYEKAMQKAPSEITAFNIALKYRYQNKALYKEWLQKSLDIDPNYNESLYLYGVILVGNGEKEKGLEIINRAFDSWKSEYENGYLSSHISWFSACARYLGKYEYARELDNSIEDENVESELYSGDHLASTKLNELEGF